MRIIALIGIIFFYLVGCGDILLNRKNKPDNKHNEKSDSSTSETDPAYLRLAESCSERDGKVMINGECYTAEVSLDINGTLSLGSSENDAKAYSVRINQPSDFEASDPYITHFQQFGQRSTRMRDEYGGIGSRKFFSTTNFTTEYGLRLIIFSSEYLESSGIDLRVFDMKSPKNSNLEGIQGYCDEVINKYLEYYPDTKAERIFLRPSTNLLECSVITKIAPYRVNPAFEGFTLEWDKLDGKMVFNRLVLDTAFSLAEAH